MKICTKRPSEKRPRECLQSACSAVSPSIAVSQNAIESVQPYVERSISSDFGTSEQISADFETIEQFFKNRFCDK